MSLSYSRLSANILELEVLLELFLIGDYAICFVACNHLLRKEGRDNPTIGLLICKQKSNTLAQYALESSSQPLGISEYELEKLYPEKIEGTMPSIKEIETKLDGQTND